MSAPFDTFDYIVYIIPGATILLFLFSLSPPSRLASATPRLTSPDSERSSSSLSCWVTFWQLPAYSFKAGWI